MAWHPSGHTLFSVYTADDADSQISILNLNKTRGVTKTNTHTKNKYFTCGTSLKLGTLVFFGVG